MNDRPSMTDQQMVKDYPRLKYEYSQLHQDYKKLKRKLSERQKPTEANNNPDTKPLIIGDVSGLLANCPNCGQELQIEVKEMTNKDIIDALQSNNR